MEVIIKKSMLDEVIQNSSSVHFIYLVIYFETWSIYCQCKIKFKFVTDNYILSPTRESTLFYV